MVPFVDIVLREGDASTRYKLALAGLGGDGAARRASIRRSERVAAQLSERGHDDCIAQHLYTRRTGAHWYSPPLADLGYRPGDMALLPPARPGFWSGCRRTSAARGGRRVPGTDSDDRRPCADPRVPRGERALRILGTGVGRPTRGGTGRWPTGWLTRPTSVTGRLIPRTPNGPPNSDWPKPCWAGGGRTRRVRIVRERRDSSTAGPPTHHRCRPVRDTDQPVGSQRPPKKVSGPGLLETGRSRPLRGRRLATLPAHLSAEGDDERLGDVGDQWAHGSRSQAVA